MEQFLISDKKEVMIYHRWLAEEIRICCIHADRDANVDYAVPIQNMSNAYNHNRGRCRYPGLASLLCKGQWVTCVMSQ